MKHLLAIIVGILIVYIAHIGTKLDRKNAEFEKLQKIHTATVEECGESWLEK